MIIGLIRAIAISTLIGPARCRDQDHHAVRVQDPSHRGREVARHRVAVVGIGTGIRHRRQAEEGGGGVLVTQVIPATVTAAAAGTEAEAEVGTGDNIGTGKSKGHLSTARVIPNTVKGIREGHESNALS